MRRSAFGNKNCDTTLYILRKKFCASLLCLPFQRRHRSHPLFAPCCSKLLGASQDPARQSSERELELLGSLPGSSASYRDTKINKKKAGEILLILKKNRRVY